MGGERFQFSARPRGRGRVGTARRACQNFRRLLPAADEAVVGFRHPSGCFHRGERADSGPG